MEIKVTQVTSEGLMHKACEATMHGQKSKVSIGKMADMEHSPLRTIMFWVEMKDIPTFVSVHLVRHKIGVEHFVKTMREDLYATEKADRDTPVNHSMFINAHSLMHLCRARLCYKSAPKTVQTIRILRTAVQQVCPELYPYLVPKCVYRRGYCNEATPCKSGPIKVGNMYNKETNND